MTKEGYGPVKEFDVRRYLWGIALSLLIAGCGQGMGDLSPQPPQSSPASAKSAPGGKLQVVIRRVAPTEIRAGSLATVEVEVDVRASKLELPPEAYFVLVDGRDQSGRDITLRYLDQRLSSDKQTLRGKLTLHVPKDATRVVLVSSAWHRDYPIAGSYGRQELKVQPAAE